MPTPTVQVKNRAGVRAILGRKDQELKADVRRIVAVNAGLSYSIAHPLTPIKTGFMRRTLKVTFTEKRFGWNLGWSSGDFTRAGLPFYPVFVVFGTSRQLAQDPLTPAFRVVEPRMLEQIATALRRAASRRAPAAP